MNVKHVLDSLNLDGVHTLLWKHYHGTGPGREPIDPTAMFKAQILKYLLQIPSDRRLAIRLKRDRRLARACDFRRRRTPSHGLFTQFRNRLGEEVYQLVFNQLARLLIESGTLIGKIVAVDSTHIAAYSGRATDNVSGRSDPDARVGRGRRGFILGTGSTRSAARTRSSPSPSGFLPATITTSCTSSPCWRRRAGSASGSGPWSLIASITAIT